MYDRLRHPSLELSVEKEMPAQFCKPAPLTVHTRCGECKDEGRFREVIREEEQNLLIPLPKS